MVQARKRAKEAKSGIKIDFVIPEEGSLMWFDMLAIPRDAPHVSNAYLFINYIPDPKVIANISNLRLTSNSDSSCSWNHPLSNRERSRA